MGRISEFDRRTVIDAALDQFWAHGFNATSTETLCSVTGLGRSSLYHAFGNKVGLYEACMSTYLADADESVDAILVRERVTVFERISILFDDLIDSEMTRRASGGPSGCFSVNTALEAANDPSLAGPHRQVTESLHRRLEILADHLRAGQASSDISASLTPSAQAEVINGAVVGIRVASRVGSKREALRAIADGALMVLAP